MRPADLLNALLPLCYGGKAFKGHLTKWAIQPTFFLALVPRLAMGTELNRCMGTNDKNRDKLITLLSPLLAPLGYEIVELEVHTHRQKMLRLFIDHCVEPSSDPTQEPAEKKAAIGIEDCTRVSRALDEPLDQMPEVEAIFQGTYELEVSSPGVERPLRQAKDYERFQGQQVRIHIFRPLTEEEMGNTDYFRKNPRQKNFVGVLRGLRDEKVLLTVSNLPAGKSSGKRPDEKKAAPRKADSRTLEEEVTIPLPLISKANLEPKFEWFDER